jgi:hypothetical protein
VSNRYRKHALSQLGWSSTTTAVTALSGGRGGCSEGVMHDALEQLAVTARARHRCQRGYYLWKHGSGPSAAGREYWGRARHASVLEPPQPGSGAYLTASDWKPGGLLLPCLSCGACNGCKPRHVFIESREAEIRRASAGVLSDFLFSYTITRCKR